MNLTLKALIVDDQFDMRFILKKALENIENVEIVAEADNGKDAVDIVENLKPNCVFLDVEMDTMNGIDAAKQILDINPKIMIVFITAYQQYMPQAFELYAFDYIVKPFKIERLKETIKRMKEIYINNIDSYNKNIYDKIKLKTKDDFVLISPEKIILIQREERMTSVITVEGKYIINETLSEMEKIVPSDIFIRSHKSYIINITKINKVCPYGRWTYVVKFENIKEDALLTHEKAKLIGF